jgi:hypothetical protein
MTFYQTFDFLCFAPASAWLEKKFLLNRHYLESQLILPKQAIISCLQVSMPETRNLPALNLRCNVY